MGLGVGVSPRTQWENPSRRAAALTRGTVSFRPSVKGLKIIRL